MNIEKIARECWLKATDYSDFMQDYTDAILEEAAKECDKKASYNLTPRHCAEAIRKLKCS